MQPQRPKLDGSSRHAPDYIMSNFETTQTDVNGALRYKLAAVEMKHFPDDDTTELLAPRYIQFALDKPYTMVEGDTGSVAGDGEQVELFGRVKVTRQAYSGKGEMTVETDYLNIRPNDEYVSTDSPVVIKQAPETVVYATGMIYEKKKQTVTLLHKVRAHYVRPKPNNLKVSVGNTKKSSSIPTGDLPNKNSEQAKGAQQETASSNARIRRRYE